MKLPMQLHRYLSDTTGKRVLAREVMEFLGIESPSTHAQRVREGFRADEVIAIAHHYGITARQALTDLGYIEEPDEPTVADTSTVELAAELARRLGKDAGDQQSDESGRFPGTVTPTRRGEKSKKRVSAEERARIRQGLLE